MSDLRVKIGADTADFDRKMKGMSSTIKGVAGAIGAGVSVGVAVNYVKGLVDGLDNIGKTSKNLGLATDFFQKLAFAAARSGSSVDAAGNGIKFMQENISDAASGTGEAAKMFDMMGISVSQLKTLSPEQQFEQISKAISAIGDQGDKTNAAMKIFGKSGAELITMMKDYSGLAAELEASGSIISDENIAAAEAFNDSLTNISASIQAIAVDTGLIGWLADVADSMGKTLKLLADAKKLRNQDTKGKDTGLYSDKTMGVSHSVASFALDYLSFGAYSNKIEPMSDKRKRLQIFDTPEEQAKIDAGKKLFEKTGKNLTQRNEEAKAAQSLRIQEEALAKEREAAAKIQAKLDDKTSQTIEDMNQEIELQILKNHGLEKEAAIQKALYDARKQNAGLSDYEAKQIADITGSLYDLSEERDAEERDAEEEKKKDPLAKLRDMPEISNQFLRVGAFMGGDYKSGGQNLQQKQVGLLEKIERNTAGFQSTDLTLV